MSPDLTPQPGPYRISGKSFALWVALWVGLGCVLRAPLLDAGLGSDDFVQQAILDGVFAAPRDPFDLFNFASGDPADNRALMNAGTLPYWSHPELNLSMYRPASSLLAHLDRALFPEDLRARHLVSFAVFALFAVAVASLYVRLLPTEAAVIAFPLLMVEEAYTLPMGWLAHRGALCALLLGVIALRVHLIARAWAPVATMALLAAALSFGEWAVPILGYFVAHACCMEEGGLRARIRRLWPAAVPALGYAIARAISGRGVSHSGIYIDATHDPARFLMAAVTRLPALLADLVFSINAERFHFGTPWSATLRASRFGNMAFLKAMPDWPFWHVVLGLVALVASALLLLQLRRGSDRERRQLIGMLALGALLSILPGLGAFVTSRLLMPAAIGYCALLALGLGYLRQILIEADGPRRLVAAALVIVILHFAVVESVLSVRSEVGFLTALYPNVRKAFAHAELDDALLPEQHLFMLNTLDHTSQVFGAYVLHAVGRPMPKSLWNLSATATPQLMTRTADNSLQLALLGGRLLQEPLARLYRDDGTPLRTGDRIDLDVADVTIVRSQLGQPAIVSLVLPRSVDDPRYVFLLPTPLGVIRFQPPALGETVTVPPAAFPAAL